MADLCSRARPRGDRRDPTTYLYDREIPRHTAEMAGRANKYDDEIVDAVNLDWAREQRPAPAPKQGPQQKQADNAHHDREDGDRDGREGRVAPGDVGQGNVDRGSRGQGDGNQGNGDRGSRGQGNGGQGNGGQGNGDQGDVDQGDSDQGDGNQGNIKRANVDQGNGGQGNVDPANVGQGNGGRGNGGREAHGSPSRALRTWRIFSRALGRLCMALLAMAALAFMVQLAELSLTVDAPHSPRARSRPEVTWAIGGSRVAAVIAPFMSAATYARFLHSLLRHSENATLPGILSWIGPAAVANLTASTERLKAEMLDDAEERWHHLQELEEYIFADIEAAWFFQRGDLSLRIRLFPRRSVYYAMLWVGAPSPEPPTRTARRRVGELQTYLGRSVEAYKSQKLQAITLRAVLLQRMEIAVSKFKHSEHGQPGGATREERDTAAAASVVHELLVRAMENSSLADDLFSGDPDIFQEMLKELKRMKASLSPNDSVFEGSWGRVFESGARALDVLGRLEELAGALHWLLAGLEEPPLQP